LAQAIVTQVLCLSSFHSYTLTMLRGIFFNALALLATAQDTPGFQFLGYGYDALHGNPQSTAGDGDPGFRTNVFKFTKNEKGRTPDDKWDVPDKTTSQSFSACSVDQQTRIFSSAYDYQHNVDNGISLSAGFMGLEFSLSLDFKHIDNETRSNTSIFAQVSAKCTAYQLTMKTFDHPEVDLNFVEGVNSLPDHYDEATYMRFLQVFGTHVVTQLQVGGRWGWQMSFNHFAYTNMLDNSIDVAAGISYAGEVKAGIKFHHSDDTNSAMAVEQSISKNSSFNVGGTFSPDKETWMASVKDQPMPTQLTLVSLDALLTTSYLPNTTNTTLLSARATAMREAFKHYCPYVKTNFDASAVCTPPQPLPPPMPDPVASNAVRRICVANKGAYVMKWELNDLTTQYPVKAATKNYGRGETDCLDGLQVGTARGDMMNCRAHMMAGNSRDCVGKGVLYDPRATQQANFACGGTTYTGSCKFTGFSAYGAQGFISEAEATASTEFLVV